MVRKHGHYYQPEKGRSASDIVPANPGELMKITESFASEPQKIPETDTPKAGRPPLVPEARDYIRRHMGKKTTEEIARHLNLSPKMVLGAIDLIRRQSRIEAESRRDVEIRADLITKPFYPQLKRQFKREDLEFFEREWVATIKQFNSDLLPTEEAELKDMIILEIMKNHALQQNMDLKNRHDQLMRSLTRAESDPMPDISITRVINDLKVEIESCNHRTSQNLSHFKDLTEKSKKTREALSASRAQRITKIQDAKANFTEWLRAIYDNENRERVAREMELMKMSLQKEEQRLGSFSTFADKKVDIPLLNAESVSSKEFTESSELLNERAAAEVYEDEDP